MEGLLPETDPTLSELQPHSLFSPPPQPYGLGLVILIAKEAVDAYLLCIFVETGVFWRGV